MNEKASVQQQRNLTQEKILHIYLLAVVVFGLLLLLLLVLVSVGIRDYSVGNNDGGPAETLGVDL